MKQIITFTAITTSLLLAGCSSNTPKEVVSAEQLKQEVQTQSINNQLNNVPEWFLTPPKNTATQIFATATGKSSELSIAIDEAQHRAEYKLAQQVSSLVSGEDTSYTTNSQGGANTRFRSVTDKFVQSADVSRAQVVKKEVFSENQLIRAYVLVKLDMETPVIDLTPTTATDTLNTPAEQSHSQLLDRVNANNMATQGGQ